VFSNPALAKACAPTIARAKEHFAEAEHIMASCPRASVRAPRIMADVYRAILVRLERRGFAAPRKPVRAPRHRVILALLRYGLL
ncbi:MAG: squalene/phytoene synthase family protein, partial [Methylocella sp.]